jgi:hypothetical protein
LAYCPTTGSATAASERRFAQYELADQRADATEEIPAEVSRFSELTKLPRISPHAWQVAFECLAAYASEREFRLGECAAWARDRATALGQPVSRQIFNYAVRAAQFGDRPLNTEPPPSAAELAEAVRRSVVERAEEAGFEPTVDEVRALAGWLGVPESSLA